MKTPEANPALAPGGEFEIQVEHSPDGLLVQLVYTLSSGAFASTARVVWTAEAAQRVSDRLVDVLRDARLARSGIILPKGTQHGGTH